MFSEVTFIFLEQFWNLRGVKYAADAVDDARNVCARQIATCSWLVFAIMFDSSLPFTIITKMH